MYMLLAAAAAIGGNVATLPAASFPSEMEAMHSLKRPDGWTEIGPAPRDHRLELTFAITQQNTAQLEAALVAASDPDSESYGEWLSNDEVHSIVAPSPNSLAVVHNYLAQHGVIGEAASPNSDFITVHASVEQAELLLGAKYSAFKHTSGHVVHRTASYSLPAHVAEAVDFVSPTVQLPTIRAATVSALDTGLGGNTPASLRKLYNVGSTKGDASKKTKQAVTAFLKQLYSASDLASFYKQYWPSGDASKIKQVGDAKAGRGGIESMLDIEYNTAMAGDVATEFWGFTGTAPDNHENEPFLKWLLLVAQTSDDTVPQLFSTSYGEDEDSVTPAYAGRIVTEFQKAGARGISLLFASGDSGAARDSGVCRKGGVFNSQWPAGSPWVTGVGATEPYRPQNNLTGPSTQESAAALSSGGFSDRWPRAAWQNQAVAAYVSQLDGAVSPSVFNATGAGFPDISAQGVDYAVWAGGVDNRGVAGTSCASPTASGVISLINDARFKVGKPALGFLNPLFYKNPSAFNDITTGTGGGCHDGMKSIKGFPAKKGWDAVTGLGTPDFIAMSKLFV